MMDITNERMDAIQLKASDATYLSKLIRKRWYEMIAALRADEDVDSDELRRVEDLLGRFDKMSEVLTDG